MSRSALIVIDMLNDLFQLQLRLAEQRARLVASINELASDFRRLGQPVVWVRQEFASDLSDASLDMKRNGIRVTISGTPGCQILPELRLEECDKVVVKKRYSAFYGTELDLLLAEFRPETLVIAGINTHACVRMTAIDAYQRDFDVLLAGDCIASYDEEHHEMSKRYLGRGLARILTNPEIIGLLSSQVGS